MEKWKKRSASLITSLLFGSRGEIISAVDYYPQKISVDGGEKKHFRRTVPEKKGISSLRLYNMLCELEGERRAGMHSLLVLRNGEVICECSADGYSVNEWHISHSMSKTVCGMVIGRLIDDSRLTANTLLIDLFPEISYKDKKFAKITVDHLLSMTSGVDFAEAGAVTERDWTTAYFSSSVRFVPGTKFAYNSMNSYILARIAERVTARSFGSLAEEYIFAPLGIKNYLWERGPEGTEKGGWGLYMSAESWAKVGYMLLCEGVFMGRRVLSEEWIKLSSTVKAVTPLSLGSFNYAYQMWTGRDNGEILFNGMLGQNVWICPQNDIIVVTSCGNNEFFQESPALEIIRKYLGGDINDELNIKNARLLYDKQESFFVTRRWVRPKEQGRGIASFLGFKNRSIQNNEWNDIVGSYTVAKNDSSVMPLLLRVLQNNLTTVIEKISIFQLGGDLVAIFTEGGRDIVIRIGTYEYAENLCYFLDDKYIIRALGEVTKDFRGNKIYKIELIFPETANTRMITLQKNEDGGLRISLGERPNQHLAENVLRKYRETNGVISFAADMLEKRIGKKELEGLISKAFNPVLIGINQSHPDCDTLLEKENSLLASESGAITIVRSLIERFCGEKEKQAKK